MAGRLERMPDNIGILVLKRFFINVKILSDFSIGGQFRIILSLLFSMSYRKETSKGLVLDILCFTIGML